MCCGLCLPPLASLQMEEYDKSLKEVGMVELMKMNAREWPYILLGILGSLIEGSAFPLFAIFFGEILRVSCYMHYCWCCQRCRSVPALTVVCCTAAGVCVFQPIG